MDRRLTASDYSQQLGPTLAENCNTARASYPAPLWAWHAPLGAMCSHRNRENLEEPIAFQSTSSRGLDQGNVGQAS